MQFCMTSYKTDVTFNTNKILSKITIDKKKKTTTK